MMEMKTFILTSTSGKPYKIFRIPLSEVDETELWDIKADVWRLYRQRLFEIEEFECGSLSDLQTHIGKMKKE